MIKHLLKKALLLPFFVLLSCVLFAQQKTVTGVVTDSKTNKGIENATVRVKNGTTATTTDADGRFSIEVPSPQSVIQITFVGYTAYEVKATSNTLSVGLNVIDNKMEEVIVVGYGTKKRVNVQGAVSTIKGTEIEDIPVANLGSSLVNRVPGVGVSFSSGKPGSTTTINIRNAVTFAGAPDGVSNQPLIVIDGIISNPTQWAQAT
ncbi:MAG: TonB-dependent receptor, partial [Chitinophagaceae bacterium]